MITPSASRLSPADRSSPAGDRGDRNSPTPRHGTRSDFEPGGRWAYCQRPFQFSAAAWIEVMVACMTAANEFAEVRIRCYSDVLECVVAVTFRDRQLTM